MKLCAAWTGVLLFSALVFSPAFATTGPLPAGKPAGVKQAQLGDLTVPLLLGGALAGGIALISAQQGTAAAVSTTIGTP